MRGIGAALAVLAFLWAGIRTVKSKKERITALWELELALELLRGELESRAPALPELCGFLRRRTAGTAQKLFSALDELLPVLGEEAFSTLWRSAVKKSCTMLEPVERAELAELGDVLGRYELQTQTERLRCCIMALRAHREEAQQNYPGQRRLCLGLSAAAGLLLAILFL